MQSLLAIFFLLCYTCKCKAGFAKGGLSLKTKVRELRKKHNLSQEELALKVGTTRQTITSIETGKYVASLPLAYKIARCFHLTIEEVFDFSEYEIGEKG